MDMEDIENGAAAARAAQNKSSKQRFKPQLSCTLCRTRKLKCDRNQPCENCIKRNLASTCTFIHAGIIRDRATHVQKSSPAANPKDVHGKIRHLEELVFSLMQNAAVNQPLTTTTVDASVHNFSEPHSENIGSYHNPESHWTHVGGLEDASESFGRISIEEEQPSYVGGSHWAAILDGIAGLKDSLEFNEWSKEDAQQHQLETNGADLLVGSVRKASRVEILASIPPRSVADLLVDHILRSGDIAIAALHSPTFKKEYERFWDDPETFPIIWIGLLYAIMCLSLNLKLSSWDNERNIFDGLAQRDPNETMKLFREKTVQCLVLSNYTEPTAYTVETLLVYALSEHFATPDVHVGGWMIMGLVVRAAMRLGFHRDPKHYPKISPFQGEMQRRLWCILVHLDIATSSSVGLPRMIQTRMSDTQAPRNLYDEEFSEDTTILPPSRPDDEMTPIGYVIIKNNITVVNGQIIDASNLINPLPYPEIMRLDGLLHAANAKVPVTLCVQTISDLKTGSPDMRVRKFSTDLMFRKAQCVLHRKYLVPPKSTTVNPHPYSTKSCVDAAMMILQAQALLYVETRPGQVLYEHKWKTTALMTQDFMLASMMICLYIGHPISEIEHAEAFGDANRIEWTREEMLQALEYSFQIWDSKKCGSKEALKAAKAMKAMLVRIRGGGELGQVGQVGSPLPISDGFSGLSYRDPPVQQTPSTWPSDSSTSYAFQPSGLGPMYDPVADMMNAPIEELDWEIWDSHFNSNNLLGDTPPDLWSFNNAGGASFVFPDPNAGVADWMT